ncbi:hypothetical protein [Polynucleobacter asymbioticus]|uniref:hypothetical protein n=1 Tax=Polynucleobacter asymbioticus TaxID=576611 RepID=UPI00117F6D71|nr:hypothetical protein [Polynucleobacter asymbioticus]
MPPEINSNFIPQEGGERPSSFRSISMHALIAVFIFFLIYYIFFDLILVELDSNAGYDASRFLYASLNEGFEVNEGKKEQILIDLLKFSFIAGFPFYCVILFYISAFIIIWFGVSLKKTIQIIIFSPALIVYLETGKDIIVVTSLIAFYSLFFVNDKFFVKRNILARLFFITVALIVLAISVAVKGITLSIYIVLSIIFYLENKGRLSFLIISTVLAVSFVAGLAIRGIVDYENTANLTAFSHKWLISSDIDLSLIFKAIARFIIYSSSPIWYWLVAIKNATSSTFLFFHAWGYLMMLFCFFKLKWWKIKSYYIAAMAFSLSYPFVHLRYFFTFLVFMCFAQAMLDSVKFKSL